jgi:hypothetical protein
VTVTPNSRKRAVSHTPTPRVCLVVGRHQYSNVGWLIKDQWGRSSFPGELLWEILVSLVQLPLVAAMVLALIFGAFAVGPQASKPIHPRGHNAPNGLFSKSLRLALLANYGVRIIP